MKNILNKIIVNSSIFMFLGACHTIEHKNIFIKNLVNTEVESKINTTNKLTINKVATTNKITTVYKKPNSKIIKQIINLKSLINLSEAQLYSKIRKGDFIKQEGRLKNIQYYFIKCFVDIFLIQRDNHYYVNFIQTRPTKLMGSMSKIECLDEITIKLKKNFN